MRETGLLGLRRVYGIDRARFRSFPVPQQYAALDRGVVQAIDVSTTDAQLRPDRYVVLRDPRNVFGFEHVAPVVRNAALQRAGPELASTLNAVSRLLTTSEVREMNAAVVEQPARAAAVAGTFLRAHGLIWRSVVLARVPTAVGRRSRRPAAGSPDDARRARSSAASSRSRSRRTTDTRRGSCWPRRRSAMR